MSFDPASEGWQPQEPRPADGFMALVGPLWWRGSGADQALALLVERRHLNPAGIAHGGMLASFADQVLGTLVLQEAKVPAVTIQLNNQFLSPARLGEFVVARGEVVQRTRSLIFLRLLACVAERAVLASDGIWKLRAAS